MSPRTLLLLLALGSLALGQTNHWDAALTTQPGQSTTYMSIAGGGFCGMPVEMGDYNGDGFPDYAVAPLLSSSGPGHTRTEAGEVTVFAGNGVISGQINLQSTPPGQPLLTINGAAAFDYLGTEMFSADVTGDGITDLILGAMGQDPNGRTRAGATYVIPGGAAHFNGGVIDLASPPSWVIMIQGKDANDRLGIWVEGGDVNGDGIDDILMGADGGDGPTNSQSNRGEAVVIFGGQAFPSIIDLASPPLGLFLSTIYGVDDDDRMGTTLYSTDLDGDGFEEFIIAAAMNRAGAVNTGPAVTGGDGPSNNRSNAGETYIVWGRAIWPAAIALSSPDPVTAASLTTIYGADPGDVLGEELSSGDFDGDGLQDLALGALTANGANNMSFWAGDLIVFYGGAHLRGQSYDMATLPIGSVTIHGENSNDILADTLSSTDVNGDGFDELFAASPHKTVSKPNQGAIPSAGAVDILFGGPVRWPVEFTLGNSVPKTIPWRRVLGVDQNDLMAYSMEAGDFDQDGFGDIFPNAMRGDGFNNATIDCGDVHIISGRHFCRGLVTLGVAPTLGSVVSLNIVGEPGYIYAAAFALSDVPPVMLGMGVINLAFDTLFYLSIDPANTFFNGMTGTLDAQGRGSFSVWLPPVPSLINAQIYAAFVTANAGTIQTISNTTSFVIAP